MSLSTMRVFEWIREDSRGPLLREKGGETSGSDRGQSEASKRGQRGGKDVVVRLTYLNKNAARRSAVVVSQDKTKRARRPG